MSNSQTQVNTFETEPDSDETLESSEALSSIEIQNKIIGYIELGKTGLSDEFSVEIDEATRDKFLKNVASGEIHDQRFQDLIADLLLVDKSEDKSLVPLYEEQIDILKEEALREHPEMRLQKAREETETVVAASGVLIGSDGAELMSEDRLGFHEKQDNTQKTAEAHTDGDNESIGKVEMIYPWRGREIVDGVEDDKNASFNPDKDLLIEAGLTPKYRLQIGPRIVNVSYPCELGNGYTAVMGYVETEGKVIAQTFYRDNEMGTWRYANEDPSSPDERGLFVPKEIQNFLSEIAANGQPKIDVKNAKAIFPEVLYKNVP